MTRSARWALLVSTVAVVGGAGVLVFLLSLATGGRAVERHFVWLYWVNVAVAALLALVIGLAAVRLVLRLRRGKFGSRLLAKLAAIFALVGLGPGLLIYAVSYQFVSRSIESWFDIRVASALDAGLNLGRGGLDALVAEMTAKSRAAADRLRDARTSIGPLALERAREQAGAGEAAVIGAQGQVLASAGGSTRSMAPERPSPALLRNARSQQGAAQLEGLDDEPPPGARPAARVRALAPIPNHEFSLGTQEERYLMLVQEVSPLLVANALAVQAAYREYQQRAIAHDGLRRMYIGTLTLALVLAVFGAVLLAVMLGNQILRPLILLADGVRQVAAGDLTARPVFASRDELGGLTRSFAQMTGQLAQAQAQVQRGVDQMEAARQRLQTILDSLSAGVIVFNPQGRIDTLNPAVTRILRQPMEAYRGQPLDAVPGLRDLAQAVLQRSELHRASPEAGERDHWQDAFELKLDNGNTINLILRGAPLPAERAVLGEIIELPTPGAPTALAMDEPAQAQLLVFDDITEVVSAQRSVAWSEVARRLAHEIKNPLTPIQLSAERIAHRLHAKLEPDDRGLVERSVATIVAQVQAMKQLVDEFRDYARLPAAQLLPLDLNALVLEVLALYGQAQEQGHLAFQLDPGLAAIEGDASQLRQVIHNLVQNALDAVADKAGGRVIVATEAARATDGTVRGVRLHISDNGPGFADKVLKRAFEPYITTKSKGTGLGLAVVKKIADEHAARVRIVNRSETSPSGAARDGGAQVSLSFSRLIAAAPAQPTGAPALPPASTPAGAPPLGAGTSPPGH